MSAVVISPVPTPGVTWHLGEGELLEMSWDGRVWEIFPPILLLCMRLGITQVTGFPTAACHA